MQKIILYLYSAMLFLVPLVMWPQTSEVFEFNKMVTVYVFTTLIIGSWLIRMIVENKFIFRRTILDIPILVFIGSQTISTILSIDPSISFLGYYSRFNGGLLSVICYALLFWAFVSNLTKDFVIKILKAMLISAAVVSIIASGEHFSFFSVCAPMQYNQIYGKDADKKVVDKFNSFNINQKFNYIFRTSCWVQDVQSRVFSTLGQPNWLAAYLVALLPIIFNLKFKIYNYPLAILLFITLLFTKSRSGLLGLAVALGIYWSFQIFKLKFTKEFFIYNALFLVVALIIGTQFTPSIFKLNEINNKKEVVTGTALESGGTESGTIRKIVWKGAIDIWQHYPIFGTGLETFAFSYYQFRPLEHNIVSEWDFVYNKAHNEYLNFAANSGTFGLLSYLVLIITSMIQIIKSKRYDFLAGYVSLLVTNFFGFSVVPTQLQLFLFPAIALILKDEH